MNIAVLQYTCYAFLVKKDGMWGREQEVSQMRFRVSLILALGLASAALLVPLLALAEVDPAARHKQLAAVIENELKLRRDSSARYQPYVHWVRLDRDQYVDAIVILKQQESSCALQPTCLGFIIQGRSDGFHVLSTFPPNQHSMYLAPLSSSSLVRTLYYSEDGEDYDEIVFSDGRYRISRRGLSEGRVREQAYWKITEREFDELATQTAVVEKQRRTPAGAPVVVRLPELPLSLSQQPSKDKKKLLEDGYYNARRLLEGIQDYFSRLSGQQLLSHSVTIDLVPCGDWMTRVPLANQRDRSSRNIVGCLEVLGALVKQQLSPKEQHATLAYLLVGTLGQAVALQSNALEGVLEYLSSTSQLLPESRIQLTTVISQDPSLVYYLLGMLAAERVGQSMQPAVINNYFLVIDSTANQTRGEFSALKSDFANRFSAASCTKLLLSNASEKFTIDSFQSFAKQIIDQIRAQQERRLTDSEIKDEIESITQVFKDWHLNRYLSDGTICRVLGQALESHAQY